jgi:hypothetical protein
MIGVMVRGALLTLAVLVLVTGNGGRQQDGGFAGFGGTEVITVV